ncbi:9588_t:CDS:2, partial [Entrophospora sp. SA101]
FTIYYSTTTTTYISAIPFSSSSIFTTNQNQLMTVDDLTRILKDIKVRKQAADYSILVDHWYQSSVTGFLVCGLALSLPDQESGARLCMGDLGVDVGA